MSPFFGLTPEYRKHLHTHIFELVYHGNGGFNFNDVYNMPVWARLFYISKIIEFKQQEKQTHDKEVAKIKSQTRKR
jgi:hypothetical protein